MQRTLSHSYLVPTDFTWTYPSGSAVRLGVLELIITGVLHGTKAGSRQRAELVSYWSNFPKRHDVSSAFKLTAAKRSLEAHGSQEPAPMEQGSDLHRVEEVRELD